MIDGRCTYCGNMGLEPGWVTDLGQGAKRYAMWIPGPLERGLMGGAKLWNRPRMKIDAYRCPRCGHLELFVTGEA
jgi:hypothetical protein